LVIATNGEAKIRIIAKDPSRPNTKFTDRFKTIKGKDEFLIRIPMAPEVVELQIGRLSGKGGFKVLKREKMDLDTKMDAFDFNNNMIAKYVDFAQEFAFKAGYTSPGTYMSDDGYFEIDYLPRITNSITKRELNTPARISTNTGIVQVSKKSFNKYTVPARLAILLHEFAHVFANKDMRDELEADFHAAQIYLALGYPTVELLQVFAKVFYKADTHGNRNRLDKLYQYAMDFQNVVHSVKYI
jgi:hypothetical protein